MRSTRSPWCERGVRAGPSSHGSLRTIPNEAMLAALSVELGASTVPPITEQELAILDVASDIPDGLVAAARGKIQEGADPLGEAFCNLRSSVRRRALGAVYTPSAIVNAMLSWAERVGEPDRVIDPGAGSGRFLLEAGRRFPKASLVAIERDPLAALTARANLAASGMAGRAEVRVQNFLESNLDGAAGRTLYIGNPPYVRHHLIAAEWKAWLKTQAASMNIHASALAGLHVYFFLAIAHRAKAGDYGALITAAEWLDVNYGQLVRELFLDRLGGVWRLRHRTEGGTVPRYGDDRRHNHVHCRRKAVVGTVRKVRQAFGARLSERWPARSSRATDDGVPMVTLHENADRNAGGSRRTRRAMPCA